MLADVMQSSSAASCAASSSSPMSQLRTITTTENTAIPPVRAANSGHAPGRSARNALHPAGATGQAPEIGGDHVGRLGIAACGLVFHKKNDGLAAGRDLDGAER